MEKLELWKQRLQNHKESGMSIDRWCAEQGLKVSTFRYWTRKMKAHNDQCPKETAAFVEVPLVEAVSLDACEGAPSITISCNQCNVTVTSLKEVQLAAEFIFSCKNYARGIHNQCFTYHTINGVHGFSETK